MIFHHRSLLGAGDLVDVVHTGSCLAVSCDKAPDAIVIDDGHLAALCAHHTAEAIRNARDVCDHIVARPMIEYWLQSCAGAC
jgi:hypothetical protein